MRFPKIVLPALALTFFAFAPEAKGQVAGLNLGAPVWNGVVANDAIAATIATGSPHIRVNFRIDNWSSPSDTTKYGGKTFFEVYDGIIDAITSQGLEVYGLLNDEAVSGLGPKDAGFEAAWVANALAIIDRYKDRVRVWETINEPNNWDETQTARMSAAAFASAHGRLYDAVKVKHPNDACWDVSLVTGPLFSFDGTTATDYLAQTINAGRAGGPWKGVRDALGHDPIDGVGYHVYVAQGADSSNAQAAAGVNANLDAVRALLNSTSLGDRKVWLSEVGYRASLLGDQGQADRLDATFVALGARSDVASIQWFTIGDFGGDETWGLFANGFAASEKRTSHARFVANAKTYAAPLGARLAIELPPTAPAGSKVVAKVKATNIGKASWAANGNVRLGAAAGCPSAWATNEIAFDAAGGYANSPIDARRYLAKGAAQGETITIDLPLTMPAQTGKKRVAVRMVQEGVAWFGATASGEIEITPSSVTPPGGGSSGGGGPNGQGGGTDESPSTPGGNGPFAMPVSGCGCGTTRAPLETSAIAVALGALVSAFVRRRARR